MSRKGNCWDNAVVESFFSSLKLELVYTTGFATHEQARLALFEYIEVFYNRQRRHSSPGYVSPVDFELAAIPEKLAAQAYCPRNPGKPAHLTLRSALAYRAQVNSIIFHWCEYRMNLSPRRDPRTGENPGSALPPSSSIARSVTGTIVALVLLTLSFGASHAHAQAWSLTKEQRQAYLYYYAPVIFQRADGNNGKQGRDWITNFDFDQDGDFSNNRVNWLNIHNYISASASGSGAYSNWRIRPTLYTSLIEYMEGGSKSLVLFYHVYHATDKDGNDIHDWERVEILVRGVSGTPGGGGEYVNHVTATMHGEQLIRRYYDTGGLNFMQTATGKHILFWQADDNDWDKVSDPYGYHAHALWHVKTPYSTIASRMNTSTEAEVNLHHASDNNVHYVFVPEGSQSAVNAWGAKPLSYATASSLASYVDNGTEVPWYSTKRITYELQDIADIVPTHWAGNQWYIHWLTNDSRYILLESPILNEAGQPEVSAGMQLFYLRSRDIGKSDGVGADAAVLGKKPLWGTYSAELNSEAPWSQDEFGGFEGLGYDSYGRTRGAASGFYDSHNSYWWQHDFFVHSGAITSDQTHHEAGSWLVGQWYTAANGGFDGRWVQLFDDRPGYEQAPAPTPTPVCSSTSQQQCEMNGGTWNPTNCTCRALCSGCEIP